MVSPCLGTELVGDIIHVHFRVRCASTVVGFCGGAGREGDGGDHEWDYVWRTVVCGKDDGVEGGHVGVHGEGSAGRRERETNTKAKGVLYTQRKESEKRKAKRNEKVYAGGSCWPSCSLPCLRRVWKAGGPRTYIREGASRGRGKEIFCRANKYLIIPETQTAKGKGHSDGAQTIHEAAAWTIASKRLLKSNGGGDPEELIMTKGETSGRSWAWREGSRCVEAGEKVGRRRMQHCCLVGREAIHTCMSSEG